MPLVVFLCFKINFCLGSNQLFKKIYLFELQRKTEREQARVGGGAEEEKIQADFCCTGPDTGLDPQS